MIIVVVVVVVAERCGVPHRRGQLTSTHGDGQRNPTRARERTRPCVARVCDLFLAARDIMYLYRTREMRARDVRSIDSGSDGDDR